MFSLIISIIAIALVAALAGASVYYGGSAFNKGTAGADASTLINGGQQINGAWALAKNDGVVTRTNNTTSSDIDSLVSDYLTTMPNFDGVAFDEDDANTDYVVMAATADICKEVNEERGGTNEAVSASTTALFGCDQGATNEFFYKVK